MLDTHRSVAFRIPATWVCALARNQTSDILVWRPVLSAHQPGQDQPGLMKGLQMSRREGCLVKAMPVGGKQPDSCGVILTHRSPNTSLRLQEWLQRESQTGLATLFLSMFNQGLTASLKARGS